MYHETQKTFGAGQGFGNRDLAIETSDLAASRFRSPPVPAVDKKRNPTGYSESDDEDVPF